MTNLRRTELAACGAAITLLLCACGSNKTTEQASETKSAAGTSQAPSGEAAKQIDRALVRFANATPASATLYFGDNSEFGDVAHGTVTPYKQLPAERHDFKLRTSEAAGEPLATNSEGLSAGKHYTVLAVETSHGNPAKYDLTVFDDDLSAPDPGKAKLRVIHAAPGVKDVDIYSKTSAEALITGASFDHATGYKQVDPAIAELDVRQNGSKKNELKVRELKLSPGHLYTVLLMGGEGRALTSDVIEDQLVGVTP